MTRFFSLPLLSVVLFAIVACDRNTEPLSLNENEVFFNEQLSSITIDGDVCYIGTEDGCIYRYGYGVNDVDTVYADYDFDRIYRVLMVQGDSIAWVGARNMGICRCRVMNDSLFVQGRYYIKVKGIEYSAYDIVQENGKVYVGTSNGFYRIPDNVGCDTLFLIYPQESHKSWKPFRSLVINSILKYNENCLVASSDDGVLRVDVMNDSVTIVGKNERVKNIVLRNGYIYALTDDALKVYDINGNLQNGYNIDFPAELYYYVPETGINFFLCRDCLYVVQDQNLHSQSEYRRVELRREIRPECRNIIVNASSINRSLLVTRNALFGIAHNLDIFNSIGEPRLASVDSGYIYHLVGNRVFRTPVDAGNGQSVAKHIFTIPSDYDVRFMTVIGGYLHFVDGSNNIYKVSIRLGDSYYANKIASFCSVKHILRSEKDITAFGGGGFLYGIRDSLLTFNQSIINNGVKMYMDASHTMVADAPYATRFVAQNGKLWVATLNDGIFVGDEKVLEQQPLSRRFSNIRDMAFTDDFRQPFVLTSHYLYTPDGCDSVKAEGFYRLLPANDGHIYGIGEFGIRKFCFSTDGNSHEDYFTDIKFNPLSAVSVEGRIYAGSACGVFIFDGLDNDSLQYSTIHFEKTAVENFTYYILYFTIIILLCLIAAVLTKVYEKKRYSIDRLQQSKGEILERLYYLEGLAPYLNRHLVEKIKSNISQVEKVELASSFKSQRMIKALRKRAETTREQVERGTRELLEEQKKMLKKAGKGYAEVLSAESARSLSFAEAALQVKKNREWLEYSNGIIEELAAIQDFYRSAALIEGVTHGIMGEVMQIRTLMATGEEKYAVAQLRERLRNIASEQNCNNVIGFIDSEIEKYRNGNGVIVEELGLLRQRTELICGNVEAMKELLCDIKKACDRISMLSSIERIASFVDTFYNCMMECKEIENALEDIPEYELGKLKALREKRETFRDMSARVLKSLEKEYSFFYTPVNERGVDSELFSLLGLSVSNCRNCSNNAKILLLLLSGRKIENNHIHILIGIPHREENMRKERWTVEQNIRKNIAKVIAYAHECPLSCASLVVDCCTAEK